MFTTLPNFTPRDSHSLWYTSSRNPRDYASRTESHNTDAGSNTNGAHSQRHRGHNVDRTALARLASEEAQLHRRRLNIQNFGSTWLKPPGIPKTLHQIREEKREHEEHQEAMRREQLAQELAEAEAEGIPEEGMMDDVQLDGAQDLDDEIPDADDEFGLGGDDDDDDEEEDDEDEEDEDEHAGDGLASDEELDAAREERENDLLAARLRMPNDAFREALLRGNADGDDVYGEEPDATEVDQSVMLDEDDFAGNSMMDGADEALDMDADLDDDIPEAEDAGYEHTDSDAELTSSEEEEDDEEEEEEEEEEVEEESRHDDVGDDSNAFDDDDDIGFAPRSALYEAPGSPSHRRGASPMNPRSSLDLSHLLSQDESSFMNSSPAQNRRARYG